MKGIREFSFWAVEMDAKYNGRISHFADSFGEGGLAIIVGFDGLCYCRSLIWILGLENFSVFQWWAEFS